MNTILQEAIQRTLEYSDQCARAARLAERLFAEIVFSDTATFNLFGGSVWVHSADRADVERVLAIAPKGKCWTKEAGDGELVYAVTIDDIPVCLRVRDGALPPTCKLVEEEVLIEAQPARVVKKLVLKCDQPAVAEPAAVPAE